MNVDDSSSMDVGMTWKTHTKSNGTDKLYKAMTEYQLRYLSISAVIYIY